MRPTLTAVIAAIEAVAVALTGLAVIAIPALLLWVVSFGMGAEPTEVLASGAAVWLLAHFVPLSFALTPETALSLGLAPEALSFTVSLVPLGLTLVTVVLAGRSGWRFAGRGGVGVAGVIGGAGGFAAVTAAVVTLAGDSVVWPAWLATLVPTLCYGLASLAAFLVRAARDEQEWWSASLRGMQRSLQRMGASGTAALPARLAETLRLATALLAAYAGLSALALAAAIVSGYVSITTLTQSLQLDGVGAFLLFLVQLALLPVALLWSGSWLTGAGFAVGVGSSASPFGALLGPLPALPLFGAIPQGWGSAGALAPALLVLGGIGIGAAFARRPELRRPNWPVALIMTVGATVLTALSITALTALSTGSIGPDRFDSVGPEPWLVGGLAAAELGVGAVIGVLASRLDTSRLRTSVSDVLPLRSKPTAEGHNTAESHEPIHGFDVVDAHETVEIHETVEVHETVEIHETVENHETVEGQDTADAHETVENYETVEIHETVENHDTAASNDTGEQPAVEKTAEPAKIAEPAKTSDAEDDELLRAFAWDGSVSADPEARTEPRRLGWRRSRKER